MMRLESDLLDLLYATATGDLRDQEARWTPNAALTVVMAANGYPGHYERGSRIGFLPPDGKDLVIFHAGTRWENEQLLSNGGRVLNVTTLGKTVAEAKERADAAIARIDWPGGFHRNDIGWRAISRERNLRLDH
jgi:phosphoribosylamine--glycine ligase